MSQLFTWGGQSTGLSALASFLSKKSQGWSPSEWTGWISLQSKGLSPISTNKTSGKIQQTSKKWKEEDRRSKEFGIQETRQWVPSFLSLLQVYLRLAAGWKHQPRNTRGYLKTYTISLDKSTNFFFFYFILLYNTVLVLPYIDMNPPRVYMSSQTWTPLLPLSP